MNTTVSDSTSVLANHGPQECGAAKFRAARLAASAISRIVRGRFSLEATTRNENVAFPTCGIRVVGCSAAGNDVEWVQQQTASRTCMAATYQETQATHSLRQVEKQMARSVRTGPSADFLYNPTQCAL